MYIYSGGLHGCDRMVVRFVTTYLCNQVLAAGRWFSQGTPISSTNKTDRHNITEILLKVALNTITPLHPNTIFIVTTAMLDNWQNHRIYL